MEHLHSEGVDCEVPGHDAVINVKVHTLLSSVDSVARPTLQGIKQYNGKYGCSFCLRRGRQIERGRGKARVYVGVQGQPRTLQQHIEALDRLNNYNRTHNKKKDHVEGVKQATVLLLLPIFNIIKSFVPDYLHSALEGVVSTFLKFWMSSSESKGKDWHLDKEKVRLLNARLLAIKPPVEVTRAPRDISQLALWKASELRSFLLYYSLVCLKGLLPNKFLRHWLLFVQSMTVFLQEKISVDEFVKAKAALTKFVEDIEVIYPNYPALYTFNVHLLLHIPKAVDDFGALWASSTFPYEHFNGVLARLIKGTQSVPQQICRSYLRLRRLWFLSAQAFSGNDFSERAKELYESMLGKSYSSHLSQQFDNGLRLFGASEYYHLSLVEKVTVQHHLGFDVQDFAESYRRMIYQSTVFHASAYSALIVRNNSIVKLNAGGFVIINRILVVQKTNCDEKYCIITGEILDIVDEELVYDRELEIYASSFIHICQRNGRIIACFPQQIAAKCVGVPHGNAICVIALVNNLERD